jgi:hypothetical protein
LFVGDENKLSGRVEVFFDDDLMDGDEWLLACVVVVSVALHASEIHSILSSTLFFTGQCITYVRIVCK